MGGLGEEVLAAAVQVEGGKDMFFNFGKKEKVGNKTLKCPRCEKDMKKLVRKGIELDICGKCGGMWLDKGEVDRIYLKTKKGEW